MKTLVFVFFLLVGCLPVEGTISRVRSAGAATSSNASTLTITLGATPAVGDWIVVAWVCAQTPSFKITNNGDFNGYSMYYPTPNSANTTYMGFAWWQSLGVTSTIQLGTNGVSNATIAAAAVEYRGSNLVVDVTTLGATANSTTPNSGTFTTNYGSELILGLLGTRTQQTTDLAGSIFSSPTNSFTFLEPHNSFNNTASNTDRAMVLLEKIVTSTQTGTSAGASLAVTNAWNGFAITFRELQGGGPLVFRKNLRNFFMNNPALLGFRQLK